MRELESTTLPVRVVGSKNELPLWIRSSQAQSCDGAQLCRQTSFLVVLSEEVSPQGQANLGGREKGS